ncbi:MAG TPA: alpha/beta hydrolase-fold protein [Candidatus Dormibacteraeota bacterium]|nr:alpha/beta hydrolase-fold protein [Candidatus Dormibacteraeota bacterium]
MQPWGIEWVGRIEEAWLDSAQLRDNPLGDPTRRPIWTYLPPGYDDQPDRRYPVVYVIQGFTGQIDTWRNRTPFRPTFPELVDRLFAAADAPPPCLVVFVDCWTSLGGSQYLDSPATGRYHSYLCEDVVPWIDARHRTLADRDHPVIMGHSSGGYGAMVTPMLRPELFGGLASHAGDALFEHCYTPEFPIVVRTLRERYGGSYQRFWDDFRSRPAYTRANDHILVDAYAMAACYSADPDGTVRLPFDIHTGRILPEVWERWLAWDPVRMAGRHADALRSLRAIHLDAGTRDEHHLDLGAEAFRRELERIGATNVRFLLHDGAHGGNQHRYVLGLRHLAEKLSP